MQPIEVLRANKHIGALKLEGNNPFYTLPLTIEGKPIVVKVFGTTWSEEVFNVDQWGKLKMAFDVSEDGGTQLMSQQLQSTLKQALEQETLPDYKLIVKNMVYNDRMYITWPQEKKKFLAVQLYDGKNEDTLLADDTEKLKTITQQIKAKGKIFADIELYCWARRDEEKHELVVGITPRLKAIHL